MVGPMSVELGSLRAELKLAGVFETRELRSWGKLLFMSLCLAGCLYGISQLGVLGALVLVPVGAVFATAIAMCGHEGSHKSFSQSPFRNAFLTYFAFPMFSGLGAMYWHNKHDRLHHGHPNVEGLDPDIKPFPFVSSLGDHEKCTPGQRWFQRNFQKHLFWPMSTLMTFGMRRSSVLYLVHHEKRFSAPWLLDVATMSLHYIGWLVIPTIIFGPIAIAVYACIWALVGVSLALVFSPAHIGLPVMTHQNKDWLHQLETTRNLELPRVISYFFIGLDYQVEHHLFPKIPHMNLPRAASITKAWCEKNKVVYMSGPYLAALGDAVGFISNAWTRDAVSPSEVRAMLLDAVA